MFTDLAITQQQALWFLIPSIPICLYVMYTDLAQMRIPNYAVLALIAVFLVVGPFVLPFTDYLWRFVHFAVVLGIGIVVNATMGVGAGDCKFAAAMAPFVALADWQTVVMLYVITSLTLVVVHLLLRKITPIAAAARNAEWVSFTKERGAILPLGVALAVVHLGYLYMGAFN